MRIIAAIWSGVTWTITHLWAGALAVLKVIGLLILALWVLGNILK